MTARPTKAKGLQDYYVSLLGGKSGQNNTGPGDDTEGSILKMVVFYLLYYIL